MMNININMQALARAVARACWDDEPVRRQESGFESLLRRARSAFPGKTDEEDAILVSMIEAIHAEVLRMSDLKAEESWERFERSR